MQDVLVVGVPGPLAFPCLACAVGGDLVPIAAQRGAARLPTVVPAGVLDIENAGLCVSAAADILEVCRSQELGDLPGKEAKCEILPIEAGSGTLEAETRPTIYTQRLVNRSSSNRRFSRTTRLAPTLPSATTAGAVIIAAKKRPNAKVKENFVRRGIGRFTERKLNKTAAADCPGCRW